jgi:hypothetical protein
MTVELSELNPPISWAVRGVDGPIRVMVKGTVEPLENGERSRVVRGGSFAVAVAQHAAPSVLLGARRVRRRSS